MNTRASGHSVMVRQLLSCLLTTGVCQACDGIGGGGGGPVLDQENRVHYRVIFHTSQYTQPAVINIQILSNVWTNNPERSYDDYSGTPRFVGDGPPCEVQFTRYEDRQTDTFLYEDSLFPVEGVDQFLTSDALNLINSFDNDPEDPLEVGEKLVRVFVMPRLATRTALGQVLTNATMGLASGVASQEGFPSIFLASSFIAAKGRWSVFTHEMSHLLAPQPTWTDGVTQFTHILTYVDDAPEARRWEWDAGTGTLVFRSPTETSVRLIANVSGQSQCDAAWGESWVRMITESLQ